MVIRGTHDWVLVVISILLAVVASFTALDLAGRVRASEGWERRLWLVMSAVAMGGGIWAMHFVAMLAFSMPGMEVSYDPALTMVSLFVAIIATGAGFAVIARGQPGWAVLALAGLFTGIGVVAMHYLGMAAMRMEASLLYDRLWVSISVLIAIGAATVALWLAARTSSLAERLAAAAVMGFAVAGMHFAGMRAAIFSAHVGVDQARGAASIGQVALALAVSSAALLILFLAMVAAMFDRRFAVATAREAEALRRSEERFRSLYRRTPLPLQSVDADGRIEDVSDAWSRLMGYSRDEVIGRRISEFMTPETLERARGVDLPKMLETGEIGTAAYRLITSSGAVIDVEMASQVERAPDGSVVHILGGLTNVTERKRAEDALRQAQKLEAIGQLTGGVAHDFNNLLAVVIGNLDLLRHRLPEDCRERRLVDRAIEGAQRGASLTQRLLAFARRQDLKPEALDLAALVEGMTDLLRRSLGPSIRIETRFAPDLPPAEVDAHQLELALLNLAVNARDAMPEGGSLIISGEAVDRAEGLPPGRYVRLSVKDTGTGMDAETLARAIDPFFTTKEVGKGTGLGLSMVQGLAAQSGGRLTLKSTPGQGTTAHLYLPVASTAVPIGEPARPDGKEPVRHWRVLAVDDDALVLAGTAALLEDMGHEVTSVTSGAEALDLLGKGLAVDLVITDQLMPGMTGLELIAALRGGWPDIATMLVTGYADTESEATSGLVVLRKPFNQVQLKAALARLEEPGAVAA